MDTSSIIKTLKNTKRSSATEWWNNTK